MREWLNYLDVVVPVHDEVPSGLPALLSIAEELHDDLACLSTWYTPT